MGQGASAKRLAVVLVRYGVDSQVECQRLEIVWATWQTVRLRQTIGVQKLDQRCKGERLIFWKIDDFGLRLLKVVFSIIYPQRICLVNVTNLERSVDELVKIFRLSAQNEFMDRKLVPSAGQRQI